MKVGRFIRANTITEAWHRGLNLIWREGDEITDERGTKTRELMNLLVVVKDPHHDMIPPEYSWNEERLEEYANQLLSGENPGFEYTYGERLRRWGGSSAFLGAGEESEVRVPVDQIESIIQRLKSTSTTRRATAVTWIPPIDTPKDEVPCMIVDDFKMREERLHLTALFRSHDFAGAYPANLYGLARLLKYVATKVGTKPGSISTISVSAHIYEHDWDLISEMLGQ